MPPPHLTVHNAEIKTATVEIRTLTVSGKQVTLAVFRQLPEEPLLDEHYTPRGVAWGIVNYHPDKCDTGPQHLHVVWQKGSELRRSRVNRLRFDRCWTEASNAYIQASFCANGHTDPDWFRRAYVECEHEIHFQWDGVDCLADVPKRCMETRRQLTTGDWESTFDCRKRDLPAITAEMSAEVAKEKVRRDVVRQVHRDLLALPQLFIAV